MVVVVALSLSTELPPKKERFSVCGGAGGRSLSLSIKLPPKKERFSVCGGDGEGGRSLFLSP